MNGNAKLLSLNQNFSTSATATTAALTYERKAKETLHYLNDYLDSLPDLVDCDENYDVDYSAGVLSVCISPTIGTYVINMQTPSRQIWLSSPISGPKRYDYLNGRWTYYKDGVTLDTLLTAEFRQIFNCDKITFEINLS
uniref:ferroxidase n=1 Tax=Syphacia muris TaxID=451379 RepID=A0A0N5AVA9_9BILA